MKPEQSASPSQRIFYVDASVQPTGHAAYAIGEVIPGRGFEITVHDAPRGTSVDDVEFTAIEHAFRLVSPTLPAIVYSDSHVAIDRFLADVRVGGFYAGGRFRYHRQVVWSARCETEYTTLVHQAAIDRTRMMAQEDILPIGLKQSEILLLTVNKGSDPFLVGLIRNQGHLQAVTLPVQSSDEVPELGVRIADMLGVGLFLDSGTLSVRVDHSIPLQSSVRVSSSREQLFREAMYQDGVTQPEMLVVQALFV